MAGVNPLSQLLRVGFMVAIGFFYPAVGAWADLDSEISTAVEMLGEFQSGIARVRLTASTTVDNIETGQLSQDLLTTEVRQPKVSNLEPEISFAVKQVKIGNLNPQIKHSLNISSIKTIDEINKFLSLRELKSREVSYLEFLSLMPPSPFVYAESGRTFLVNE